MRRRVGLTAWLVGRPVRISAGCGGAEQSVDTVASVWWVVGECAGGERCDGRVVAYRRHSAAQRQLQLRPSLALKTELNGSAQMALLGTFISSVGDCYGETSNFFAPCLLSNQNLSFRLRGWLVEKSLSQRLGLQFCRIFYIGNGCANFPFRISHQTASLFNRSCESRCA